MDPFPGVQKEVGGGYAITRFNLLSHVVETAGCTIRCTRKPRRGCPICRLKDEDATRVERVWILTQGRDRSEMLCRILRYGESPIELSIDEIEEHARHHCSMRPHRRTR